MSINMTKPISSVLIVIFIGMLLSGCPRIAKVNIYNNAGVNIFINNGGNIINVAPRESKILNFTSTNLVVESSNGKWLYGRDLIPYNGKTSEYFKGVVYLQINNNGQVFAAKKNEKRPQLKYATQPEGFPIEPNS